MFQDERVRCGFVRRRRSDGKPDTNAYIRFHTIEDAEKYLRMLAGCFWTYDQHDFPVIIGPNEAAKGWQDLRGCRMYVEISERATLVPQNATEEDWMAPRYAPQLISPPAFIQAIDNGDIVVRAQHLTCQFCGDNGHRMMNRYRQYECPVMQERTLN